MRKSKQSFSRKKLTLLIVIVCCILGAVFYFFAGHMPAKTIPGQSADEQNSPENTVSKNVSPSPSHQKDTSSFDDNTNAQTKEKEDTQTTISSIQFEQTVFMMSVGDTYTPDVVTEPSSASGDLLWESEDENIASVSSTGTITAKKDGITVIHCSGGELTENLYINVVTSTPGGSTGSLTLYNDSGKKITYHLYHQSAHTYGAHSAYLAWHGCAHCSLATVLGAYSKAYPNVTPDQIIDGVEKKVAGNEAWTRHHVTKSAGSAMPLSLSGISDILDYGGVPHKYIRTFKKESAKEDILSHLKTGNPVLFEVRKRSNITGKKDSKWTSSVHTMVFLGVYTNGKILVSDSVNHNWYSGGQRAKIAEIDDLMEYMYPCTSFDTKTYFKAISSDGGYMKINEKEE